MGIPVWCVTALVLLTVAKGEIYDNVSESYYEKPESSSPAPAQARSATHHLVRMKELVLYLTPDQVQALESAGAVVKPFPEFENAYVQRQYQQSVEENTERQYEPATSSEAPKDDSELDDFYKVLNIQQINEDLPTRSAAPEQSTEKSRPKYKYTQKSRQQEYSTSYVQKKLNRGKSQSTEYVRYLPSFETEDLKIEPYRVQPLPGYRFEDVNVDYKPQVQYESGAPVEIKLPEEIRPIIDIPTRTITITHSQAPSSTEESEEIKSSVDDKGPVTFKDREPESAKARQGKMPEKEQEEETPKKSAPAPTAAVQRQYSSLLAPLLQHEKITESITKQKEELVNNEKIIKSKLQQLKDSGNHDEEKYAIELDKLNKNLVKQNALAQKLALETIAKKPQGVVKEEIVVKRRRPVEILKQVPVPKTLLQVPKPSEVKVPQPYPLPLQVLRPIPVPVLQPENIELNKPERSEVEKQIPNPLTRNVFVKVDNPYLLSKSSPIEIRHELESKYPILQPDKLSVIRHLWEH